MSGYYLIPTRHLVESPRSWWLECETREQFTAALAREQARMARSKASGWVKPMTIGGTATQPDRLRSPRTGL